MYPRLKTACFLYAVILSAFLAQYHEPPRTLHDAGCTVMHLRPSSADATAE